MYNIAQEYTRSYVRFSTTVALRGLPTTKIQITIISLSYFFETLLFLKDVFSRYNGRTKEKTFKSQLNFEN